MSVFSKKIKLVSNFLLVTYRHSDLICMHHQELNLILTTQYKQNQILLMLTTLKIYFMLNVNVMFMIYYVHMMQNISTIACLEFVNL